MKATRPRSIVVRPEPHDGGYTVEIIPPFDEGVNFDNHFQTRKHAWGYACGLRMTLALTISDLCDEMNGAR